MSNVPAVLITGGALGAELAAARVIGTLAIALYMVIQGNQINADAHVAQCD